MFKLTITDNGKGLPIDFDLDEGKGLGLGLIHRLSKQLHGDFQYTESTFVINFKDAKMRLKTA